MMFSATRSITGVPETRRPRVPHGFAHAVLVLAWVVFWLNSALFPCCEALAAAFGGHSNGVSQSVSAAQPAHRTDETHSECPHHNPDSPCNHAPNAGPVIDEVYEGLSTDRVNLEWFAIDVSGAAALAAVSSSANLRPRDTFLPRHRFASTCTPSAC